MKKLTMCFLLASLNVFAFRIDGITFDQSLDKSGYKEYKVYNDSLTKSRYKVKISNGSNEKVNMSSIVKVYPQILTVEPHSYAILKLFGDAPKELDAREYDFNLEFAPVVIPTIKKNGDKKTVAGTSSIKLAPSLAMSGYGGTIDWAKSLKVKSLDLKKSSDGKGLEGDIVVENKAHSGLSLGIKMYDEYKNKLDSYAIGRIPKQSTKSIKIKVNNFEDPKEIKKIVFYTSDLGDLGEVDI